MLLLYQVSRGAVQQSAGHSWPIYYSWHSAGTVKTLAAGVVALNSWISKLITCVDIRRAKYMGTLGLLSDTPTSRRTPPAWRAGGVALTRQVQYHLNQVSNLHWIPRGPILCAFASSCQHRWLAAASPRRDGVSQSVSQAHSDFLSFHWMAKKERNYSKKCLKTSWQFLACSQVRTKGKWTIPRLLLHRPHTITKPHNALWTDT